METDLVPGKYQLTESDNFDNFMGALGVSYLVRSEAPEVENISNDGKYFRKLGNRSKPLVTLSQEGKEWTMKSESLVKTTESKFEMDKQFEELTADGRKVLTTMKVTAPNTVYQEMLGTNGGKDSFCTREFMAEKMKCVCTVEDIETVRWYERK